MARDGFAKETMDRLAKRAGMRCSFPDCRLPTSGPDIAGGVTNLGVAAHITAASPGGARYDVEMSSVQRSDISNGIWLCQTHAKLIDDDELSYPPSLLREWREVAEHMAALEARGYQVRRASPFPDLESKAPKLIAKMREDILKQPLVREFIVLSRSHLYNAGPEHAPFFVYYTEEHRYIASLLTIMQHVGAVHDVTRGNTPRYNFTEEFVGFLDGTAT